MRDEPSFPVFSCRHCLLINSRGGGKQEEFGESPSGKAPDFDSGIRRFDPYLPSQVFALKSTASLSPLTTLLFGISCRSSPLFQP